MRYVPNGSQRINVNPITKPVWKTNFRGRGGTWGSKTYIRFLKEIKKPLINAFADYELLWLPLRVDLLLCPKRPKASKFPFPQGDVDNFSKSILDALTDVLWVDDWQVQTETIHKEWAPLGEEGFFSVTWKTLPGYEQYPIFMERKIGKELADG